jgi:hypothetical protein
MADNKNIARRLNLQTGLGVSWSDNFRMQDGLIANRGQVVIHELGIACTCRSGPHAASAVRGSGDLACSKCENGILYREPLQIMGLVIGTSSSRELVETGFINPGDCLFSISPNLKDPPSDFDKITFTWPENIGDGQVIVRGLSASDDPASGALNLYNLAANEDFLHYQGVQAIYCEDEHGKVYNQGSDFRFEGRKIVWSNGPAVKDRYTIKYKAYLEWIVYNSPMSRRDRDTDIGYRIVLRKKHLVNLRDAVDEKPMDKALFRSRVSA